MGGDELDLEAAIRALSSPLMLMERILDEALRLVVVAEGAVVSLAEDDRMTFACTAGTLTDHVGRSVSIEGSLAAAAMGSSATVVCDDTEADPRANQDLAQQVGARSLVCVPLQFARREIGTMALTAGRPRAFGQRDLATLAGLAPFVSAAIGAASEMARATDALLSADDPLDGAPHLRDTRGMSAFIANVLHPGVVADIEMAQQVEHLLAAKAFHIAYQPLVDVMDGRVVCAEALTRFATEPYRSPDLWFQEAWRSGLGAELELAAVEVALSHLDRLPGGCRLAVNLSPPVVTRPQLRHLLEGTDAGRVVIELTEHAAIDDYPRVRSTLASLRELGVHLAVDDTGAGFASLSHIIKLAPDLIKLDYELIHGIASDPVRRSLATAIVGFAGDIGAEIVAEGIETDDELDVVRALGIRYGQGYLLGRPGPLDAVVPAVPVAPVHHLELDALVARTGLQSRTGGVARWRRAGKIGRLGRTAS